MKMKTKNILLYDDILQQTIVKKGNPKNKKAKKKRLKTKRQRQSTKILKGKKRNCLPL